MPGDRTWQLAITRRCLEEDLGLSYPFDWDQVETVPIISAFADRRGLDPETGDRIEGLVGVLKAPILSLHFGDARAGTWYDEAEDVVWLVGVGWGHDYDHLIALGRGFRLLPTAEDYSDLEARVPDPFEFEQIGREARRLIAAARSRSGAIVEGVLAGRIQVRVCLESEDPPLLTVALSQRLIPGTARIPRQWLYLVAQAFFPGSEFPADFVPFAAGIDASYVRADELALALFVDLF